MKKVEFPIRCAFPVRIGGDYVPCGKCMPCRTRRRREWTGRIILETLSHAESAFVTLTYSPENLPRTLALDPTLDPRDLTLFLKRLRKAVEPVPIRYFAVGEYGARTFRPHYHVLIFGLGPFARDVIEKAWGLGFVTVGTATVASARYCAHYTTKKMTTGDDPRLKEGQHPEFARMSRMPGIGAGAALESLASTYKGEQGKKWVSAGGGQMRVFRYNGRFLTLDRYIMDKLSEITGLEVQPVKFVLDPEVVERCKAQHEAALRRLREHGVL